jgi:hypothetical protein
MNTDCVMSLVSFAIVVAAALRCNRLAYREGVRDGAYYAKHPEGRTNPKARAILEAVVIE